MFTELLALHCMAGTERVWEGVLFLSDGDKEAYISCLRVKIGVP